MERAETTTRRGSWRLAVPAGVIAALLTLPAIHAQPPAPVQPPTSSDASAHREIRGLWVLRTSLSSPAAVRRIVDDAASNGFNTLLVQVRGRGDAFYHGGPEPLAEALRVSGPRFDPLDELLALAKPRGLAVHAWINTNFVASAHTLPTDPAHVAVRHPEWLMVPRALARELRDLPPSRPAFVQRLAAWTREQRGRLEGLYTSPVHPEVTEHVARLVATLARNYVLDGVHLDYVRYPSDEFDYSAGTLAAFRATVLPDLTDAEREVVEHHYRDNPFAYADRYPLRWAGFRRTCLTAQVMRVRTMLKAVAPDLVLSAAVVGDADEALSRRLQDWALWLDAQLLDAVCPMLYTTDAVEFRERLSSLAGGVQRRRVWVGIGSYRLTPQQTVLNIASARAARTGGVVLFSYDSLVDPARGFPDYLSRVGRLAFGPAVAGDDP
jgi:uncharacterized lipoprotein YddW (UPF0748 family)